MQRLLAIPMKRFDRPLLGFLDHPEVEAILNAPDQTTWSGCRDHAMFVVLYNTGARVSEVATMNVADVSLAHSRAVRIHGKGRKDRVVPLWKNTTDVLKRWLTKTSTAPEAPLFPNRHGQRLSRSGIEERLRTTLHRAAERCASLRKRKVSPHTFRHTTAMHLLQSGVDVTVIAIWLGHENPATTHLYIEADLAMKERALAKLAGTPTRARRYKASDKLLAFLDGL
jgi:integrase/recombinase XerD